MKTTMVTLPKIAYGFTQKSLSGSSVLERLKKT